MEQLSKKILGIGFYSFIEKISVRIINILTWIIIIRFLSRENVGIIGIALGYLSFLNFINIAPENVLYRDFPKIKKKMEIERFFSSFLIFSILKFFGILSISIFISFFLYFSYHSLGISLFFMGISFITSTHFFISPIKELLKVDFKQRISTFIEIVLSTVTFLLLAFTLYTSPSLLTYIVVYITMSITGIAIWFRVLKKVYNFKLTAKNSLSALIYSLSSFSIWNHFNGAITYFIYNIDPVILSICGISLLSIGNYTTSLKISNFFFFLPMILQNTLSIAFSNLDYKKSISFLKKILFLNFIFAFLQLIFFFYAGKWLIKILFTKKFVSEIFQYSLLIITGVTILNISRPLIAWLSIKSNIKKVFLFIYLPVGVISFPVYFILTKKYSALGTAFGNIILYSLFSLLLIIQTIRYYKNEKI